MGGRGVIAIITWVVATLIIVSLAWVAVSHAVAGIADPIPNIMGHGKEAATGGRVPARDDTSTIAPSPGAASAFGAANAASIGATARTPFTGGSSGAVDRATGAQEPSGTLGPVGTPSVGGQGAASVNGAQQATPKSAGTAPAGGRGAGGANGTQPAAGIAVPAPAPTTTTAPGTVKSFGSPGGTITVRCAGESVELVSATPQSGYSLELGELGPDEVDVNFASSSQKYDMQAGCQDGLPAASVDD